MRRRGGGGSAEPAEPDHLMREHKQMTHVYRFCMGVDLCCLVTADRGTGKEGLVDGRCRSTKLFFSLTAFRQYIVRISGQERSDQLQGVNAKEPTV